MEKLLLGLKLSTSWTDPPMLLMATIPYAAACLSVSAACLHHGTHPLGAALPWLFTWLAWNVGYHRWLPDRGVDTTRYLRWRDPALRRYYRHRRVPMAALYEYYIAEKFDWNPACEGGDCYQILRLHRDKFVNYKVTAAQLLWLSTQFLPAWLTGTGLGVGSSSGKSVPETAKEIDEHYNKGNRVFAAMLGQTMTYTCAIFGEVPQFASDAYDGDYHASASDGALERAQHRKIEKICERLELREGETFLDIGCGWGTLVRHVAKNKRCQATGVTLSREGHRFCNESSDATGADTEVLLCDYREIPPQRRFDKIASIEMAEHVGLANFGPVYLNRVREMMQKPDSRFVLQVSGLRQGAGFEDLAWGLFMAKYIFPGADASTPLHFYIQQCELAGFEVEAVENLGGQYSWTLHKWYDNWLSHKNEILRGDIDAISEFSTGVHLFRLQEFFLAYSTIAAAAGSATCYQLVLRRNTAEFPRCKVPREPGRVGAAVAQREVNAVCRAVADILL